MLAGQGQQKGHSEEQQAKWEEVVVKNPTFPFSLCPTPLPSGVHHTLTHNFSPYEQTEQHSHQPEPALQVEPLGSGWALPEEPQTSPDPTPPRCGCIPDLWTLRSVCVPCKSPEPLTFLVLCFHLSSLICTSAQPVQSRCFLAPSCLVPTPAPSGTRHCPDESRSARQAEVTSLRRGRSNGGGGNAVRLSCTRSLGNQQRSRLGAGRGLHTHQANTKGNNSLCCWHLSPCPNGQHAALRET